MSTRLEQPRYKFRWLWIILIIAVLAGGAALYFSHKYRQKAVNDLVLHKPMVLLLIGMDINILAPGSMDNPKAMTRTDTLILAVLDPYRSKISLVSIPRDSLVNIPGHGVDRINCASVLGGYNLTKQIVSELTGYKIDRYAVVNFASFKQIVDLLGGVWVNVDKKMRYADEYGHYTIRIDPGMQLLNGDKALQYVRFRNEPLGDIARVTRQRTLLIAVFKKMIHPVNILKWPQLIKVARKYMVTDMSTNDFLKLMNFARTIKKPAEKITTYTLPGNFYEAYWQPDPVQVSELMNKIKPEPVRKAKKNLTRH